MFNNNKVSLFFYNIISYILVVYFSFFSYVTGIFTFFNKLWSKVNRSSKISYSFSFPLILDVPFRYQIGFQDPATLNAENIHDFHNDALVGLIFICSFVVAMLVFVWNYFRVKNIEDEVDSYPFLTKMTDYSCGFNTGSRKRLEAVFPLNIRHDAVIETWWTALPSMFLIFLAVPSFSTLYMLDELENPSITIRGTGVQWYWRFELFDYFRYSAEHCQQKPCVNSAEEVAVNPKYTDINFYTWSNPHPNKGVDLYGYHTTLIHQNKLLDLMDLSVNGYNTSLSFETTNSSVWVPVEFSVDDYLSWTRRDMFNPNHPKCISLDTRSKVITDSYFNGGICKSHTTNSFARCEAYYAADLTRYWKYEKLSAIGGTLLPAEANSWVSDVRAIGGFEVDSEGAFSLPNFYQAEKTASGTKYLRDLKRFNFKFESHLVKENDLKVGNYRNLEVDKALILPFKTEIRLLFTALDVLHSFAVPSLGIKLDACPGRLNETGLFAQRQGTFYGQCSEICGVYHGFMPVVLEVSTLDTFYKWVQMNRFFNRPIKEIIFSSEFDDEEPWIAGARKLAYINHYQK